VRTEQDAAAFRSQLTGVNVKPLSLFATGTLLAASLSVSALGQAAPQALPSSDEALRPFSVHAAQVRLHGLGMYTGTTNGLWNQATQTAVERFQQNRGLPPSGRLDPATLAAMGLSPNEGGAG
jgi:peptidoglycan hydrolase-like protein with peptidoglycan-binding domain